VSEFFDVDLEDNHSFKQSHVRFRLTTPSNFARVLDYNMGTKKSYPVFQEHVNHVTKGQGADTLLTEKIEIPMRDGMHVPVVLVYDKRFYTEESQWLMFTQGFDSTKEDLAMHPQRLSLTNRGIVCAYPMLRGTQYFDDNWMYSGAGDRKMVQINDLIDTAIFAKENELTNRIALMSTSPSGSLAVLASIIYEPYLFEGAAVMVSTLL
jgi:protease II